MKLKLEELAAREVFHVETEAVQSVSQQHIKSSRTGEDSEAGAKSGHPLPHVTRIIWDQAPTGAKGQRNICISLEIDGIHAKTPVACGALFLIPTAGMWDYKSCSVPCTYKLRKPSFDL